MHNPQYVRLGDTHHLEIRQQGQLPLCLGTWKHQVPVQIMSKASYDIILGQPWILEHTPIPQWAEYRLTIPKGNYILQGQPSFNPAKAAITLVEAKDIEEDLATDIKIQFWDPSLGAYHLYVQ
ncbi:hypothetical protein H4R33_007049 [Dimargaris cristalligena]|nr:hypothetical protein H4R33_007049 [Dimargaris cristalligena]